MSAWSRIAHPRWWRWLLVIPFLLCLGEMVRVMAWTNRHTVIDGRVYRCSQPSGSDLRNLVKKHGIRTVLNLRGLSPEFDWYQQECQTCHDLTISQEDITLSANRLPPPAELKRLIEVLDRTEYPILIHCRRGADRTGLVSAIVLLLQTDSTLDQARVQLLPRYGHFRFGRTAAIDEFFDLYADWLQAEGIGHSPDRFRQWALGHYQPGRAVSRLKWLDPVPETIRASEWLGLRVKVENRSRVAWEFKPGVYAGVHVAFGVFDDSARCVWSGRTGLRTETVPPGGTTEVLVPVIGLQPGHYKLIVDIHDATGASIPFRTTSFVQYGDDSLAADLHVK